MQSLNWYSPFTSVTQLIVFGGGCGLALLVTFWLLQPSRQAAKQRSNDVHYTLSDVLALFVMLQYPLWFIAGNPSSSRKLVAFGVALIGVLVAWRAGVRLVSQIGFHRWWERFIYLALLIPWSIATTLGGFVCFFYAWQTESAPLARTLFAFGLLLTVSIVALRRLQAQLLTAASQEAEQACDARQ